MNRHLFGFPLLCLLLAIFAGTPAAAQWTRFRGPDGSGQSDATTIPTTWSTEDYNWRVKLPGVGHSSPIVWGEKIFVTCGEEQTAARIIRCLNTSHGGLVWKRTFESDHHGKNDFNSYGSSTPTVDKDHVYMAWAPAERPPSVSHHRRSRNW